MFSLYPVRPALPARFRRPRVLIVGCGDVGTRLARLLVAPAAHGPRARVLVRDPAQVPALRALGVTPLQGDLDRPASLRRLAGLAQWVVHLAPPPSHGDNRDARTRALVAALRRHGAPSHWVYGSTSGVYGDRQGQWTPETTPLQPLTARARRRVDAEQVLLHWARQALQVPAMQILRIPGIYAPDREGGTPRSRLERGTPVLCADEDVYTNHIHADDLARACRIALWRGRSLRTYNANDDSVSTMGAYFDMAADLYGLPRPPRITLEQAREQLSAVSLSFMQESRRLDNTRIHRELRLAWHHPTPAEGLRTVQSSAC